MEEPVTLGDASALMDIEDHNAQYMVNILSFHVFRKNSLVGVVLQIASDFSPAPTVIIIH